MTWAYSAWREPWLGQDPVVNLLIGLGAVLLVAFLLALSFETPRRLRVGLSLSLLAVHIAYILSYARAYDLHLSLFPLLDIFHDPWGRGSAVLDFSQLMLLYLLVSYHDSLRKVFKALGRR